jgi:hypothetical protein
MSLVRPALFVLALTTGCSSAGTDRTVTLVDAGGGTGSGSGTPDAPTQAACLLRPQLGAPMPMQQEGHSRKSMGESTPDNFYLFADLNQDTMPDILLVDLWKGYGAFTSGFPTSAMTINLAGTEASYETCGACITVQTDYTMSGPTGDPYIATAGSLALTSVSPTSIAGTLSNVTFTHVTIDPMSGATTPHADGCAATLTSVAFSATPTPDTMFTGSGRVKLRIDRGE